MRRTSTLPLTAVILAVLASYAFSRGQSEKVPGGNTVKNDEWRVKVLDDKTAGTGLPRPEWMFEVKRNWQRGTYRPHEACSHDGQVFRAAASGETGHREAFLICDTISCRSGRHYARWRVRIPAKYIEGARFSYVDTKDGPWQLWCNRNAQDPDKVDWFINVKKNGIWTLHQANSAHTDNGWFNMQVLIEPTRISLTSYLKSNSNYKRNTLATFEHDSYPVKSSLRFGSAQEKDGGPEVASELETLFVDGEPYHYVPGEVPDGPEDIRAEDDAICYLVGETNPWNPRITEGDLIVLKDGSWLLVYSDYYTEEGWDSSPARLSARRSEDKGKTWSEPWIVAESGEGSSGNVMSVSLTYAKNGDLLLAYHDKTPDMKAKAMVLRRSKDDGRTWGPRIPMSPNNGNRHIANNACFRWLKGNRLTLACREYVMEQVGDKGVKQVRWPYCLYSDDDGVTWTAGKHVPDPGLSDELKIGQNINEPSIAELADGRLLMTMRSIAGGQFFSFSSDRGETWTKPYFSPLRGACSPATIKRIPNTGDVLAIWTYGFQGRLPLVSAISGDDGKTWKHLKLVEQSLAHGYCYTSMTFLDDHVILTYMHYSMDEAVRRHDVVPHYHDLRLTVLPVKWFYRDSAQD